MGIDAVIKAVGPVTDDQLAEANARVTEWIRHGLWAEPGNTALERYAWEDDTIEVTSWWRYYGPGYERGPWPDIYRCIRAVQAWLPQCRVYYGGDSSDHVDEVTDEFLREMWAHYSGPDSDACRQALAPR